MEAGPLTQMNTLCPPLTALPLVGAPGVLKYSAMKLCVALLYCHTDTTADDGVTVPTSVAIGVFAARLAGVMYSSQPRASAWVLATAESATVTAFCACVPVIEPT